MDALQHLHLGIFLSSEHFLENHLHHALNLFGLWRWDAIPACEKCRGTAESIHRDELLASLRIAQYVPSLKTIGWSTCCGSEMHGEISLEGVDRVPKETMLTMPLLDPSFVTKQRIGDEGEDSGISETWLEASDDGALLPLWQDETQTVIVQIAREDGRVKVKSGGCVVKVC